MSQGGGEEDASCQLPPFGCCLETNRSWKLCLATWDTSSGLHLRLRVRWLLQCRQRKPITHLAHRSRHAPSGRDLGYALRSTEDASYYIAFSTCMRHGNLFTKVEWSSVTFPYACPTTEIQFKLLRNPAFVHGSGTKCHLLISQHHDRSEQPPTCHFIIILCMYIYVTNTIIDTLISCSFKFTHYSFNTNQRRKQGWLLTKAPHILNASMWRRQLAARVTNNSSSSHPNDLLAPCRQ